jgi:hypothetical protein
MELKFSSLTETVESFSTNYVPGSSPRGKTGDPRECPPARFQDIKPDLILQSSGSGGARVSIASFFLGYSNNTGLLIPLLSPTKYLISLLPGAEFDVVEKLGVPELTENSVFQ